MDIQLAGYTLHRQDRIAHFGKTTGGSLCIFVNNTWCTKSKEVSEVEYFMINCRPHYLPREFSAILFVAVYLPPQRDAGTKTALSQLYKEKKTGNHSPRGGAPSGRVTLMQGNLNQFYRISMSRFNV